MILPPLQWEIKRPTVGFKFRVSSGVTPISSGVTLDRTRGPILVPVVQDYLCHFCTHWNLTGVNYSFNNSIFVIYILSQNCHYHGISDPLPNPDSRFWLS